MTLPGLVAANNLLDVENKERAWDNLGSSIFAEIPIPAPSLDLNFAESKSLIDDVSGNSLITFSRSSTGTFVGSNGFIQTAASGVPRFDHNPTTGESLGLLIEEARTNECTYSNDFTSRAGHWGNYGAGTALIPTLNAGISPDGTNNAVLLTLADTSGGYYRNNAATIGTAVKTFSIFLKAGTVSSVGFRIFSGSPPNDASVQFNLAAGTYSLSAPGISVASMIAFPNGWYKCSFARTDANNKQPCNFQNITQGNFYAYGAQSEPGAFPTSYIPTVASAVTRAADVAQITGSNFSSWFNPSEGTFFLEWKTPLGANGNQRVLNFGVGSSNATVISAEGVLGSGAFFSPITRAPGSLSVSGVKVAVATAITESAGTSNGDAAVSTGACSYYASATSLNIVPAPPALVRSNYIARVSFWPKRLLNPALQYITSAAGSPSSATYPYTFTVKGKDSLALNGVRSASTRDFVFIKGLNSPAQPRLTTAAQQVASGTVFQGAAMLKASPTTSGNYLFSSGLTLSGVSTHINNTPVLSIATSPFSGSTATVSILLRELQPQANWRITEPMPSGTLASPEFAIPFETSDFVLFMKAGQN